MNAQPILLRVSRHIDASAERVFDAWLDPAIARRFLFATPTGQMQRVEIDPRVGGGFCVVERRDGQDAAHHGRYLEIDRPHRLAFSFSVEPDAPGTRVAIDIQPAGDAACAVVLVHAMDPAWVEHAERTRQGWQGILDALASYMDTAT